MNAARTLTPSSSVRQSSDQVSCDLDREVVLLNIKNGDYYNFDDIASDIWRSLGEPMTIRTLVDRQLGKYRAAPEQCEQDVLDFLEELLGDGLIEIV